MKKLLVIVMILLISFNLFGCKNKDDNSTEKSTEQTTQQEEKTNPPEVEPPINVD